MMRGGFSLIEVLVAFAVMSLLLVVLIPQQSYLYGRAASSADEVLANDFALSIIEPIGVVSAARPVQEQWDYRNWTVTLSITASELGTNDKIDTWVVQVVVLDGAGLELANITTHRPR